MIIKTCIVSSYLILLVLLCSLTSCQKEDDGEGITETGLCLVLIDGNFVEAELDKDPLYLDGGMEEFYYNIGDVITYPPEARENHIQGTCIVNYEITESGTVENIIAIQDPGGGIGELTESAIEAATSGVSFSPDIYNGNPVRVKKGLSIKFKLQ